MATVNIPYMYQGEDKVIDFVLKKADGTVQNLNDLTNVVVLIIDSGGNVLEKYSREVLAGFNNTDFDVTNAILGEFSINMRRSVTLTACTGTLKFEIKVSETNVDFTSNKQYSIAEENIFSVMQSKSGQNEI